MFKKYEKLVSDFKAGIKTDETRTAFTHSKQVSYLKHMASFLMYDYAGDYQTMVAHIDTAYAKEAKANFPKKAQEKLMTDKGRYSWHLPYQQSLDLNIREDITVLTDATKVLLQQTLSQIVCKEKYLDLRSSTTEAEEYLNTIAEAARQTNKRTYHTNLVSVRFEYQEEPTVGTHVQENTYYGAQRLTLGVNKDWYHDVYLKDMANIEHQGVKAHVLSLKKVSEDEDMTTYDAEVVYIKGTAEQRTIANSYWGLKVEERLANLQAIIKQEKLSIAIDKTTTGFYATGKDASWASRTLRRRQKAAMMKSMGI